MKTRFKNILILALTILSLSVFTACTDDDFDLQELNEIHGVEDGEIDDEDI